MRLRTLGWLLLGYGVLLLVACLLLYRVAALHPTPHGEVIASLWQAGELAQRVVRASPGARDDRIDRALAQGAGELVLETVVQEGGILRVPRLAFAMSLVPARDGLRATLDGKTVYVTPDDLLARHVYDHGFTIASISLTLGSDVTQIVALLSERLAATAEDVMARATLRRIRVERTPDWHPRVTGETLSVGHVRDGMLEAARYLARNMSRHGYFRYRVDPVTDRSLPGYNWPRHAGATFFLAQAADITQEPQLRQAALWGAALLRGQAMGVCGSVPCVGDEPVVALGASALALLAFTEVVHAHLDESYRTHVMELSRFVRGQQRPDGEFMHYYDRRGARPIDRQGLYYSSEATLALARAYPITQDPADLEAAVRGLRHLVGPAWSFFGNRYYFGEEHWTCQAMAALWPYAPDPQALDFCLRWQAYGRAIQQRAGDTFFDSDGAIGVTPVLTPRLTPVASRCEAAAATLDVARRAGVAPQELEALEGQLRRALALLLRQQFRPGPRYLFKNPHAVLGAMPGSEVDWDLRIDYAQHMGSAMVRWLKMQGQGQ
jgi:hypothetical protein